MDFVFCAWVAKSFCVSKQEKCIYECESRNGCFNCCYQRRVSKGNCSLRADKRDDINKLNKNKEFAGKKDFFSIGIDFSSYMLKGERKMEFIQMLS